ncbi:hypothetical protein [Geodermatophilus sabuli]|uniref:hypothetical protein n=1 Tax=Geodermatophilus sabuli TaxID=1564158 RepID=UPI00117A97E3|nr:hypothetical protein [Geodermatophilus sabuli]MBB3082549.1 hypothetical protein [Geodermatophilus sabuli]
MTQTWGVPVEVEKALAWPVEQVALHLLRNYQRTSVQPDRRSELIYARQAYHRNGVPEAQASSVIRALAEAFDWLVLHGLLSEDPPPNNNGHFITRKGREVLESTAGPALLRAQVRLVIDLHPSIAQRVRSQVPAGGVRAGC